MRKIKYLVASLFLMSAMANANPVPEHTASVVAANFYKQTYSIDAGVLRLAYTETSSDGQALYYVYNVGSENGFVIVSAEDAGYPVIASSTTGHYVVPTTNNNVGWWMGKRKNEIISMRANNIQANSDVTAEWNNYINNTARNTHQAMVGVAPLCQTTWDQSPYYNQNCPGGSVTGCVATAMAQIMKYWAYPAVGTGSWCYYDEISSGDQENYGELCATFDTSHYAWSAMPNSVTSLNREVAKLMYDCGVSVDMDYSPSGSGSIVIGAAPSAQNSYVEYFGYYQWSIQGVMQNSYTKTQWLNMLENELNNGRPIQYEGQDPNNGGHSWVCDGYNSSNQLYMNWGWSGTDDAYYTYNDLAPTGSGDDFSQEVGALIGIMPAYKGLGVAKVSNNTSLKVYPNPSNGIFNVELESVTGNPQISVYNVLGQEVYTSKITNVQTSLNLSNQAKGVYMYRILNENGDSISTGRLIIQ
jgi:hypothetical protein